MIEAVVFDVGETLADETRAWGVWADHLGIPRLTFFAALGASIARGGMWQEVFELFRPGLDMAAELEAMAAQGVSDLISLEDLYPDALPTLRALGSQGYRLGVAGNQPAPIADVIEALGVDLDVVGMSEAWGVAKPDAAFFARISASLDLAPNRIAYVGDRIDYDVRPAKAAGMVSVWIRRGKWAWIQGGREVPPEADLVIPDLASLPAALAEAGLGPPRRPVEARS